MYIGTRGFCMYDKSIGLDTIWPRLLHLFGIDNYLAAINDDMLNDAYNIAKSKLEAKFHGNKKFPTWSARCDALASTLKKALVDKDSLDDRDVESVFDTSTEYQKKIRLDSSITSLMGVGEIIYRSTRDNDGHILFDRTNSKLFDRLKVVLRGTDDTIDTANIFSVWHCSGLDTDSFISAVKSLPVLDWNNNSHSVHVTDVGDKMADGVVIKYRSDGGGKYSIFEYMDVSDDADTAEGLRSSNEGDRAVGARIDDTRSLLANTGLIGFSLESDEGDENNYICIVGALSIGGWLSANEYYNELSKMASR